MSAFGIKKGGKQPPPPPNKKINNTGKVTDTQTHTRRFIVASLYTNSMAPSAFAVCVSVPRTCSPDERTFAKHQDGHVCL
ncbi:hypothetical protein CEXT_512351 [Caerostris extrusa]|uniref:Uncharacterized protein n=1 Tax=Caerostris extrusa TaxID=172846 RepID=A0AAV4T9Y2_CAEEX|nr:hypothetical protein CEXT_512351 [Caerostris extrusa]